MLLKSKDKIMKIRLILIWILSIVVLNTGEYIIKNSKYSVDKTIKNIEKCS